jgi:hypothetical protein
MKIKIPLTTKELGQTTAIQKNQKREKTMRGLTIFLGLASVITCFAQDTPDWAKREYAAPAPRVYVAALRSIQMQRHEVKIKDDKTMTVNFHVGTTAWSWGYNMQLVVSPVDETHSRVTVGILRSGSKAVSWGSGKKEVRKILAGIDAEVTADALLGQPK